jgi:spermidine synthase
MPEALPPGLRFLTQATIREMFDFPRDMGRVPVEPNHLHSQALVRYYEREWREVNR